MLRFRLVENLDRPREVGARCGRTSVGHPGDAPDPPAGGLQLGKSGSLTPLRHVGGEARVAERTFAEQRKFVPVVDRLGQAAATHHPLHARR
jgi:hypothetical protein